MDALAAARKANLKDVVGQLKTALLEFHPTAAGSCKLAALKVLDSHGGYDDSEDDDEEEEDEEGEVDDESKKNAIPSSLYWDAIAGNGSLDAFREDVNHEFAQLRSVLAWSRPICVLRLLIHILDFHRWP